MQTKHLTTQNHFSWKSWLIVNDDISGDDIIIQYSNVTDCVFSIPENTSANISFHLKDTKCTNEVICMIEISRFNNNSKTFETQCTFVLKDNNCFSKELYCSCFSFHGPYLFTKTMERADNTKWKISMICSNKTGAFIKINVTRTYVYIG